MPDIIYHSIDARPLVRHARTERCTVRLRILYILTIFLCLLVPVLPAAGGVIDSTLYKLVDVEFDGQRAFEDVAFYTQYWRIAGGSAFDDCLAYTVEQLVSAGFRDHADTPAWFWIEEEDIKTPVWDPVGRGASRR